MSRKSRSFGLIRKRGKQYYARWTEFGRYREVRVGPSWDQADRFLSRKAMELGLERATGVRPVVSIKFEDLLKDYESIFAGEKGKPTLAREGYQSAGYELRGVFGVALASDATPCP